MDVMKEVGKTVPVRLLQAVLVLGVTWLPANAINVVLDSKYCRNDTITEITCNYINSTAKEIILGPHPKGCDKWNTLRLIGAEKLDVTISCLSKIIVSSSSEVNVTVYEAEKDDPNKTLNINNSFVTSLKGFVGRLYIRDSHVTSLTTTRLSDLDLTNSWVGSLNTVVGNYHDSNFTNSIIESVDHLEVIGNKPLTMKGGRIGVVKSMIISSRPPSRLEHVVIDLVPKGGLQVKNGDLILISITIGSLETKAIAAVSGTMNFTNCKIEKTLLDSFSVDNHGELGLINTSIRGTQCSFSFGSPTMTFPFAMLDLYRGFSIGSMVGSAFLGALILFMLALMLFLACWYRQGHRFPSWPLTEAPDTPEERYKLPAESTLGETPLQDPKLFLPAPTPPIENDKKDSKSFLNQMSKPPGGLPPELDQAPQPPSRLPPVLGQPPQPPSGLSPRLGKELESARQLPGLGLKANDSFVHQQKAQQRSVLHMGPHPGFAGRPLPPTPKDMLKLKSLNDETSVQENYDDVGRVDEQEIYDDVNRI